MLGVQGPNESTCLTCGGTPRERACLIDLSTTVTRELLEEFLQAFNNHDLDAIMSFFAEDCVFYMPRGEKPRGDKFEGKTDVRAGLAKRFDCIPYDFSICTGKF